MTLQADTKDLHHACEAHPVGAAMSAGTVDEQTWADWLGCLFVVHETLDRSLPDELRRVDRIALDIAAMGDVKPTLNKAAVRYAAGLLESAYAIRAATYVFTGAHLMGGEVMRRRLEDRLPCAHLRWDDRRASLDLWRPYRECVGISAQARDAFAAILKMMDEMHRGA